jgi:hypothetical protein
VSLGIKRVVRPVLASPEFVEVGANGRQWARGDVIATLLGSPDPGDIEVPDHCRPRRRARYVHDASLFSDGVPVVVVVHDGDWVVGWNQATPAEVSE